MIKLVKEEVNKKYTYTWTKMHDDAKFNYWRKQFIDEFGGEFVNGVWKEDVVEVEPQEVERIFLIINPDGTEDQVTNFAKYCRDRGLNRAAMYAVLKGTRKQHKGYRIKGD